MGVLDIQYAFAIQTQNVNKRKKSTGGGFFRPVAEYVLKNNGRVFGAAYDNNFVVKHMGISKIEDIEKLQGSKYVQSEMGDTYVVVESALTNGQMVLFCGTPCQVAGLDSFLSLRGVSTSNLIRIGVACRAVPSPLIFKKYIEMHQERLNNGISAVNCRDKFYGYSYSTMSIYSKDLSKKDYHNGLESDEWLRCFFSGICDRPCCSKCHFRDPIGDFFIGDYFRVKEVAPNLDDDKGTTRLIITSQKGLDVFESIKTEFNYVQISTDLMKQTTQSGITKFGKDKEKRKIFFKDAQELKGKELFKKYYPRTFKIYLLLYSRRILFKLGLYKIIKSTIIRMKKGKVVGK